MQVIASSSLHTRERDVPLFERLAGTLSSQFARLPVEEIVPSIAGALEQVAGAVPVDASMLVEFAGDGVVSAVHRWPQRTDANPGSGEHLLAISLLDRLARQEVLTISSMDDVPEGVRQWTSTDEAWSALAVPGVVAGQVVCALILWTRGAPREWSGPMIERTRLVAEIIGAALQRYRNETALRASMATIERLNARLAADNIYLQEEIKTYHDFDEIVGESEPLRLALGRLGQVAPLNSSVLLLGETGTGKELFARAVHNRSRRQTRALVKVNCAALPATLIESELFGHEKGAFTGAVSLRQGRFELADGGTIFLDEIGDLTPELQAKLLRVLQEGEFERVGSSRTRRVDVRVIAATHHDLDAEVAAGRFRADLYYRLSVFPIHLPPLRERQADIPSLVWFFIHRHQRDLGRRITKVPQTVMYALQQHSWPGNVRELENVIERGMIRSNDETLRLDDTFGRARRPHAEGIASSDDSLDAIQRAHIENILVECGWRINGTNNAAERLGVHPNTLRFRMKKLGISSPERRPGRPAATGPAA